MYNLAQADAKWVKNSAVEKKLRWEGLSEEVAFQKKSDDTQWHGRAVVLGSGAWRGWPRRGCLEVGEGDRECGRSSRVLSKGNGSGMTSWSGCLWGGGENMHDKEQNAPGGGKEII